MRQTIQINLAGFAFQIDEDAYKKLHSYLSNIEKALGGNSSTKEVLQDVEARIAEILLPTIHHEQTIVVTLKDIEEVAQIIGPPADFGTGIVEDKPIEESKDKEFTPPYIRKRLHRDPYNRVFGGVCSGLGAYFKVDPILFRILFVVGIFWGVFLLPYVVLWIVMPKAITLEQRRQMFGEDDIQHKPKYPQFNKSKSYDSTNGFWKVIKVALGAALVVSTFIGLMALTLSILFSSLAIDIFPNMIWVHQLHDLLFFPEQSFTILIGVGLLVGVPLLVLFYLGLYLIFQFQKGEKTIGALALLFWLVGLGLVVYSSVGIAQGFRKEARIEENITPQSFSGDTLYLNSNQWHKNFKEDNSFVFHKLTFKIIDKKIVTEGDPVITIKKNSDRFALTVKRKANGKTIEEAESNAQDIEYFWLQKDSVLQIDPYFTLRLGAKVRLQELEISIEVPKGKHLKVASNLQKNIKQ